MPIISYKNIGETPLDIVNKYRKPNCKYSFAGRLDPMARGKMIVLEGIECKNQDKYCGLDKIYEFEILFGFSTDTYDILGIVEKYNFIEPNVLEISNYLGEYNQSYPPYSSIIVNKQPLWWWAKNDRLGEIEIPKKLINIYDIESLGDIEIENNLELLGEIKSKINKLNSNNLKNFRADIILEKWENILQKNPNLKPTFLGLSTIALILVQSTNCRSFVNNPPLCIH